MYEAAYEAEETGWVWNGGQGGYGVKDRTGMGGRYRVRDRIGGTSITLPGN